MLFTDGAFWTLCFDQRAILDGIWPSGGSTSRLGSRTGAPLEPRRFPRPPASPVSPRGFANSRIRWVRDARKSRWKLINGLVEELEKTCFIRYPRPAPP